LNSQNSTSIKSLAIQGYLSGKSRDQIAKETGASTGKVSYIINDWKKRIGISDIDEVRAFAITVKKSGLSIQQCAQGYRMSQLIKNLDIVDDDYDNITTKEDVGINNNSNRINPIEFSAFVQDIYLNCKKSGISPSIILPWITDLLTTFGDCDNSSYSNRDYDNNTNLILKSNLINIQSDVNPKQKSDSSLTQTQIPFISKVQRYINQKKKEYIDLKNYKKRLETRLNRTRNDLNLTKQTEEYVMEYIDWFYDLKSELEDNHSFDIKDFKRFAWAINNFKNNGFNIPMIIAECTSSSSLTKKIKTMKDNVKILQSKIISLNKSVSFLENKVFYHKQIMDIYYQLEGMGLGLHQLKQLLGTILEIAAANNIPAEEAVSKFLKDVKNQYDNKLGFENIVNEKKDELVQVSRELNNSRQILWCTPLIGPSLSYLFQKGISEQDIIGISQLVEICTINTDLGNSGRDLQSKHSPQGTNNNNGNIIISRSEYWKQLIDDLKKYDGIKLAIKDLQEKRDTVAKEIEDMQKQKQEVTVQCQNGLYFIKELYYKIINFKEFMDRFSKDLDNKIRASSKISSPLPIFIICNNSEKNKEKEDKDNNEGRY
jgi:hypothetical protein